tara:strand:- start:465 stop:743 length:279 start_codon:yes stop_codon:yes gene_type:complete
MTTIQIFIDSLVSAVSTEQTMPRSERLLPPVEDSRRLALELRLTPRHLKEDALQEAWLAHLDGRDPARAVNTFVVREKRHRKRNQQLWEDEA